MAPICANSAYRSDWAILILDVSASLKLLMISHVCYTLHSDWTRMLFLMMLADHILHEGYLKKKQFLLSMVKDTVCIIMCHFIVWCFCFVRDEWMPFPPSFERGMICT